MAYERNKHVLNIVRIGKTWRDTEAYCLCGHWFYAGGLPGEDPNIQSREKVHNAFDHHLGHAIHIGPPIDLTKVTRTVDGKRVIGLEPFVRRNGKPGSYPAIMGHVVVKEKRPFTTRAMTWLDDGQVENENIYTKNGLNLTEAK